MSEAAQGLAGPDRRALVTIASVTVGEALEREVHRPVGRILEGDHAEGRGAGVDGVKDTLNDAVEPPSMNVPISTGRLRAHL